MSKSQVKSVFLSTPMSVFTEDEYEEFISWCKEINHALTENENVKVYCAALQSTLNTPFQNAAQSVKDDFKGIDDCQAFILIYPKKLATSALIELGYAVAQKKPILMIAKNSDDLPFMAKALPEAFPNVDTFVDPSLSTKTVAKIKQFIHAAKIS